MRCYDGCPDSALQAKIDERTKWYKELAKYGMRATYFPVEQGWIVFKGNHPVTEVYQEMPPAAKAALRGSGNLGNGPGEGPQGCPGGVGADGA